MDTFTTFRVKEPKFTKGGWKCSVRLACALKLVSVIHVRVVVFGDNHSVGKLAAGEGLHGFLTVGSRDVLHKDLKLKSTGTKDQSATSDV